MRLARYEREWNLRARLITAVLFYGGPRSEISPSRGKCLNIDGQLNAEAGEARPRWSMGRNRGNALSGSVARTRGW